MSGRLWRFIEDRPIPADTLKNIPATIKHWNRNQAGPAPAGFLGIVHASPVLSQYGAYGWPALAFLPVSPRKCDGFCFHTVPFDGTGHLHQLPLFHQRVQDIGRPFPKYGCTDCHRFWGCFCVRHLLALPDCIRHGVREYGCCTRCCITSVS